MPAQEMALPAKLAGNAGILRPMIIYQSQNSIFLLQIYGTPGSLPAPGTLPATCRHAAGTLPATRQPAQHLCESSAQCRQPPQL
jgi:hypothetical protein